MKKSPSHIDTQLKGMFETFQPPVPFQFEAVSERLDAQKSRRRVVLWSSVAAVVFTAVSGLMFLKPDTARVNNTNPVNTPPATEYKDSRSPINHPPSSVQIPSASTNKASKSGIAQSLPTESRSVSPSKANVQSFQAYENAKGSQVRLSGINVKGGAINGSNPNPTVTSVSPEIHNPIQNTESLALTTDLKNDVAFDIFGRTLQNTPISFGDFLQLPVRIPSPQTPIQPLSSWAFEVGYDQNQTAMAYQISPGREKYVHKNYLERMRNGEFALNAPQLQASIKYYLNPNWSVAVGLGFAQTRTLQQFDFRDSVPFSVSQGYEADALGNFPIFGYLGLGQRVQYEGTQTLQMLSIPMAIAYQYPLNRFWSLSTEISTRYNRIFAAQGKTLNYHDLSLLEAGNEIYRGSIWSARFSAGAEYRFSRNQYLGLRLNTQGAFTPLYKADASVQNRGWSLGMSVFYTLKLF